MTLRNGAGRFSGKTAIVTGAARGLGAAEAATLAREGATVFICDVLDAEGQDHAASIVKDGGKAVFHHHDVAQEQSWVDVVAAAKALTGRIDVLVNNAGVMNRAGTIDTSLEKWNRVLGVNLTGAFLGMKTVAPVMRAGGGGAVVNIASHIGFTGHSDAAYTASKWALRGLTKSAAMEFAGWGIRVNAVCPGLVHTGINRGGAHLGPVLQMTPMKRAGKPSDIAALVAFLASDEAGFITGEDFVIDGGFTAGAAYRRVAEEVAAITAR